MTVVSTTKIFEGQTGSKSSDSKLSYTANYRVVVSSESDGPEVVLESNDLPRLNSHYSFGNDFDSRALLKSLTPNRVDGNRTLWIVQALWETPGDKQMEAQQEDGTPTKDPTLWHDDIEISTIRYTRPVEKAYYRGGYSGEADKFLKGTYGPVVNSAFVPFDPPLEMDDNRQLIRISKWFLEFPEFFQRFINFVNRDTWQINKPNYGYTRKFGGATVRCNDVCGSFQIVNSIPVWKVLFEFEYRRDTWHEEVLDRGLDARAWPRDKDGQGNTISSNDVRPGEPLLRRMVDKRGVPIGEPVMLDGDGKPLLAEGEPVYGKWQKYMEVDFAPLVM